MIFVQIDREQKVQVNDKTRIDASKSFLSGTTNTISSIEIDPDGVSGFFDVTTDGFLDWAYPSEGQKVVSCRITDSEANQTTGTITIEVVTAAEDNLFSNDDELKVYEPDLLRYVQDGRNSFIDKHRIAQFEILDELEANLIYKEDGTKYTAEDIVNVEEFRKYSTFLTLEIIFEGLSNDVEDIFRNKANKYSEKKVQAKKRAQLHLDSDGDGDVDRNDEVVNLITGKLVRR
jgi:hypothetical protein